MSLPNRPLRSVMIGDTHYMSPYIFGVSQAMSVMGHQHSQICIRNNINTISKRLDDMQPDVIWGHMLLWGPPGSCRKEYLMALCEKWKRKGAHIVMHDGDCKPATRHPFDISRLVSLAICNHEHDRSKWGIPQMLWPYFAFYQTELAQAIPDFECDLFFAGTMGSDPIYGDRSKLVAKMKKAGINFLHFTDYNTLFLTPTVSRSATSVLGFGRPQEKGWTDTRVFQYPGAGAILIHDHADRWLTPGVHYVSYEQGKPESVIEAVNKVKAMDTIQQVNMRMNAFEYVQQHHSSVSRVSQVLSFLYKTEVKFPRPELS